MATRALFFPALLALAACDQGEPTDVPVLRRSVHLVSVNVGTNKPLPADGSVELTFDRWLLPSTILRQSVAIVDAFGQVAAPVVLYDPISRKVTLANPRPDGKPWLLVDQPYRLLLGPHGGLPSQILGLDGGTLAPDTPAQFGFSTIAPLASPQTEASIDYCRDIQPFFETHCISCHGGTQPEMGLSLQSPTTLRETAFGRTSRLSNNGATAHLPRPPDRPFAIDMPIVDPGSPGTSFLLYKLLLADTRADAAAAGDRCSPSPNIATGPTIPLADRVELSNYIGGTAMPKGATLTPQELARVGAWIAQGADARDCSACTE